MEKDILIKGFKAENETFYVTSWTVNEYELESNSYKLKVDVKRRYDDDENKYNIVALTFTDRKTKFVKWALNDNLGESKYNSAQEWLEETVSNILKNK